MESLAYLGTTEGLIWVAVCLPIAFLLIFTAYFLFNKFPAKWYCDYDEEPSEELLGRRVSFKGSGIILSIIAAICLMLCRVQFNKGFNILFAILGLSIIILFMITVSDFKYTIIPDQFTAALALVFLAVVVYDRVRNYNIFSSEWWQPLAGAAIGGGAMLLINALGVLIYKKEGMGFGDVKLFAAIGILTGFPGTIYTIFISLIIACIGFIVTLIITKTVSKSSIVEIKENSDNDDDDDNIVNAEQSESGSTEETEQSEEDTKGSYLAFGPYIAIGTIIYICFLDLVNSAADMYLALF